MSDSSEARSDPADPGSVGEQGPSPGPLETIPLPAAASDPFISCSPAIAWTCIISLSLVAAAGLQIASGQAERGYFLHALCGVILCAATVSDVATRRIANRLTYPAILLGIALNLGSSVVLADRPQPSLFSWLGATGPADAAWGFGAAAALGLLSFSFRGLGGGDVKLLAAMGAMLGLNLTTAVLFNGVVFAAAIGATNWLCGGKPMQKAQAAVLGVYCRVYRQDPGRSIYRFRPGESPFALSLTLGFFLAHQVALHRVMLGVPW